MFFYWTLFVGDNATGATLTSNVHLVDAVYMWYHMVAKYATNASTAPYIAATAGIIIAVTAVRNGGSGKGVQTKLHPHIPSETLVTGMCIKAKVDTITM